MGKVINNGTNSCIYPQISSPERPVSSNITFRTAALVRLGKEKLKPEWEHPGLLSLNETSKNQRDKSEKSLSIKIGGLLQQPDQNQSLLLNRKKRHSSNRETNQNIFPVPSVSHWSYVVLHNANYNDLSWKVNAYL